MRSFPLTCACALTALLLAGCGGGTKTASAASQPATGTSQATSPAATTTAPAVTTRSTATTAPAATSPSTTRSAPEPAFTEHEGKSEGVAAAAAVVRAHGYTPNDVSEYHAGQTLRVLVATRTGSGDGYGQQAFFFVGPRYIGTDAKEASANVKVI